MKKVKLFLTLILLLATVDSLAQNFTISAPKAEFDGQKLTITYDLISSSRTGIYFLWIEIKRQNGNMIRANSFKGEIGDSIISGKDKTIVWTPEDDAIFLDEDVTVEIKGEEYIRSFNKEKMIIASTALPGLGQTKITKGKPYWIAGVAAYGTLVGGLIVRTQHNQTILDYENELDPVERSDFCDKSQQQKRLSDLLLVSAGVIWIGNIIWVAATPNKFKPMQHAKLSLYPAGIDHSRITMLSLKFTF
jgi:hypothetical protein